MKQGKVYVTIIQTVYVSQVPIRNQEEIDGAIHNSFCFSKDETICKNQKLTGIEAVKAAKRVNQTPLGLGLTENGADDNSVFKDICKKVKKLAKQGHTEEAAAILKKYFDFNDGSEYQMLDDIIG